MIAEAPRHAPAVIVKHAWVPEDLTQALKSYRPQTEVGGLFWRLAADPRLDEAMRWEILNTVSRIWVMQSELAATAYRGVSGVPWLHPGDAGYDLAHAVRLGRADYHPLLDPRDGMWGRLIEDYGVVCRKVITNAGVNHMVSDLAGAGGEISNFHFHALGTGTVAENATDTALGTELTTEYTGNVRATGSQVDNTATPHTFTTVGVNTLDSGTPAVTEHGVMSASSAGVLWDRSVFSVINLNGVAGDGLSSSYTLSISAGG